MRMTLDAEKGTYTITGSINEAPTKNDKSILLDSSRGTIPAVGPKGEQIQYKGKDVRINCNITVSK